MAIFQAGFHNPAYENKYSNKSCLICRKIAEGKGSKVSKVGLLQAGRHDLANQNKWFNNFTSNCRKRAGGEPESGHLTSRNNLPDLVVLFLPRK